MLSRDAVEREEEALRAALAKLPDARRAEVYREAEKHLRDPDTYAALNWLLVSGLHHFYLRNRARGVGELAAAIAAVALFFTDLWGLGILLLLGVAALELYALFRSQVIVQDYNNRVLRAALDRTSIER